MKRDGYSKNDIKLEFQKNPETQRGPVVITSHVTKSYLIDDLTWD